MWVVWDEWGDEEYVYGVMGMVCGVCEGCVCGQGCVGCEGVVVGVVCASVFMVFVWLPVCL